MQKLTRKEQKEKTRQGLIQQAEKLFALKGIAQTTTADVALSLKVSHGTVFIHFPTREELVLAVVEKFGERLSAELGARCSEDLDLKDLLQAHIKVLSEFEDFYLRLISESQFLPAQVRSLMYAMNSSLSYRMYNAAKIEMKNGQIKKIEQATLFNTWLGILHYHIMNRDLFSDATPVLSFIGQDLLKQFYQLLKI